MIQLDGTQIVIRFFDSPVNEVLSDWSLQVFHGGIWTNAGAYLQDSLDTVFATVTNSPGDAWRVITDNGGILWRPPFVGVLLPQNGVILPPD